MAAISPTIFSVACQWMKSCVFWLQVPLIPWSLFLRVQLTITQYWFKYWLGAELATIHYLNQCWPDSLIHICGISGGRCAGGVGGVWGGGRGWGWRPYFNVKMCFSVGELETKKALPPYLRWFIWIPMKSYHPIEKRSSFTISYTITRYYSSTSISISWACNHIRTLWFIINAFSDISGMLLNTVR